MQLIQDSVAPLTLLTLIDSLAPLKLQARYIFAQRYVTSYKKQHKTKQKTQFQRKTVSDNCRKSITKERIVFRLLAALALLQLTNSCKFLVINKFMIITPSDLTHLICVCELKTLISLVEWTKYLKKTTMGFVNWSAGHFAAELHVSVIAMLVNPDIQPLSLFSYI